MGEEVMTARNVASESRVDGQPRCYHAVLVVTQGNLGIDDFRLNCSELSRRYSPSEDRACRVACTRAGDRPANYLGPRSVSECVELPRDLQRRSWGRQSTSGLGPGSSLSPNAFAQPASPPRFRDTL